MSTPPRTDSPRTAGLPLLILVALCASLGCGGTGDVHGKITYKGKPVVSGSVLLLASDHLPYYGEIQKDGAFTIPRVPLGAAALGVNSPDPRGLYSPQSSKLKKMAPASPPDPKSWFPLPAKTGDPANSGLKATIVSGLNTIHLDLKDD